MSIKVYEYPQCIEFESDSLNPNDCTEMIVSSLTDPKRPRICDILNSFI